MAGFFSQENSRYKSNIEAIFEIIATRQQSLRDADGVCYFWLEFITFNEHLLQGHLQGYS